MKINKDVFAALSNQLWRIISGPLLLLIIPTFLTPIEQGYWYTFISIAALSVFADLGFSTIILQFTAHEFAFLHFSEEGILTGDKEHLYKIAAFFGFAVKWLSRIVCVVFPFIMIGGYFFLQSKSLLTGWQQAWLLYSTFSGLVFFTSSILYFFEGCNSVGIVQSIRLKISICTSATMLLGLVARCSLYALAVSAAISGIISAYYIYDKFKKPIKQLWKLAADTNYDWWPEFSQLIWRYAISWCSGYFIFQLFTPLAFKFHGPEFAGKVGISVAAWTAGYSIANSWMIAITPKLNMFVAEKKWSDLDALFNKNFLRTVGTMLIGGVGYFLLYFLFINNIRILTRFLDVISMFILFSCWFLQVIINNWALYLRAHKKEPLMILSAISAIYVSFTTYLSAKYLGESYLFLGFLSSYFWGVPIVFYIWKLQKKAHKNKENISEDVC